MKTKLVALAILLAPALSQAQNGGQLAENESLKLEIVGSVNGRTIIKVTNKQACTTDIKFYHDGVTDTKTFAPLASDTFQVALTDCTINATPTTNCGGANMGWVEWNVCVALPIRFEWIRSRQIDAHTVEVSFKLAEVDGSKLYVQMSTDALHFKRVLLVTEEMKVGVIYSVKVKI